MKNFSELGNNIVSVLANDIESILVEADTGDLQTWAATKGGLSASAEFTDPNSSKYKYVAYYSVSSKEVDHFLVTYDQHTNNHHSTDKTLTWNDTRQTRKQAYNSLICSDIVKNTMGLKPKQGSDAECAVAVQRAAAPAPAAPRPSPSAGVSTAPQEEPQAENICSVDSKIRRRKIILDFSKCPITPDLITGGSGISFPRGGITKIVIKKKSNDDQSPFLDTELRFISFNMSKKDRSQRDSFNNYFNYLRRIMRYVIRNNWEITGDLSSFPSFTVSYEDGIREQIENEIDDIVELLLEAGRGATSGGGGVGRNLTKGGSAPGRGGASGSGGGGGGRSGRSRFDSSGNAMYGSGANKTPLYVATGGGNSSVANKAKQEYNNYKDFTEDQPELKNRIQQEYWPAAGEPSSLDTVDAPWSAAFISFVAKGTGLKSSIGHATYMRDAMSNRESANGDVDRMNAISRSKYVAFLPAEKSPSHGDIVCKPRGTGNGWDDIGAANHCDIYVGNNKAIGGNLSNSVGKNSYSGYTMIISKGATVASIESNNAVASNDSDDNDSDTDSDDSSDA